MLTDAEGNATLGLLPLPQTADQGRASNGLSYTLSVFPPSGSPYGSFSLDNLSITGDITEELILPFIHPPAPLTVTIDAVPTGVIEAGRTIVLAAKVSGGFASYSYQWTKNGSPFSAATSISDIPEVGDATHRLIVVDSAAMKSDTVLATLTVIACGGGGGGGGAPPPNATPELDSLVLFRAGLAATLGGFFCRRRNRVRPQEQSQA